MRKTQKRNMNKRFLSAALALGMVLSMLPSDGIEAAAKRIVSDTAKGDVTYTYNNYTNAKTVARERKVVKDTLSTGIITDSSKAKGSTENPFVIVEVTPQKDYSSIGYLVDECEPANMYDLGGNKLLIDTLTDADGDFFGFGKFTLPVGNVYFFPDEKEGDINFYQNTNLTGETVTVDGVDIASHESALRFTDAQWELKKKTALADSTAKILGYYEAVPKGDESATFILKTETTTDAEGHDVTTRSIVKADASNKSEASLFWHTMNTYEINQALSEGVNTARMFLSLANLNNPIAYATLKIDVDEDSNYVGNRFYTERVPSAEDPFYDVTGDYYIYQSYDLFTKNTLGLTDAQAKNYSITVKTITPYELSRNSGWVDIADLIYFNADLTVFKDTDEDGEKDTDEAGLIDLWQSTNVKNEYMNRFRYGNCINTADGTSDPIKGFRGTYDFDHIPKLGPSATLALKDEDNYRNKSRELTLDIFYRILTRVSKTENYLAVIFDQNCTDPAYNDTKASITYYRYRLGYNKEERTRIDGGYGATGYQTNVAKLWLACTSANPGLVQRFMIDGSIDAAGNGTDPKGQLEVDADGIIKYKADSHKYPTGRDGDNARQYWSGYTFYCAEDKISGDLRESQKQWDYWDGYAGEAEHDEDCYYVQGHVFVTPEGTNLVDGYTKVYSNDALRISGSRYVDFNEFLSVYGGSASPTANKATSSLATKYIIDADHYVNYYLSDLTVLDIEPSVKMKASNSQLVGERAYEWQFGYNDVYKLIPKRMGTDTRVAKIEHEVMQAFVAKNEDLNSTYDLIYIGDDIGGLWTGSEVKATYFSRESYNGATAGNERTDFADDTMDGWVYFHIGDILYIANDYKESSGFLSGDATAKTKTRQSGNDLTNKKMAKLVDYLDAGYPIVVADNLYPGNLRDGVKSYVDPSSVMYNFLTDHENDPYYGLNAETGYFENCYYTKKMLQHIDKSISNRMKGKVTIVSGPTIYDSSDLAHSYLSAPDGYAVLNFVVDVPNTTDYKYRVFIDRNRDSNFTYDATDDEKNEVITSGYLPLTRLHNTLSIPMPDKWVGFVQWRIEVVNRSNEHKRYSMEGCSAVAADPSAPANSDRAKKKIVALQITPTHNSQDSSSSEDLPSKSWVHLGNRSWDGKKATTSSGSWQYLYNDVQDFDIEVIEITWRQFMQLFKPEGSEVKFKFNMGAAIDISDDVATSNPRKDVLERVEKKPINFYTSGGNKDKYRSVATADADKYYKLEDFNMIVLGFDDAFGFSDMSNEYGNVEYLYYFALKGCSILFTHDTTSQWSDKNKSAWNTLWSGKNLKNNESTWHEVRRFGYTGNTMMREIMGMNRYMKFSSNLTGDTNTYVNFRSGLADDIKNFVTISNIKYDTTYDTTSKDGLHGFSLYNLLRYACGGRDNNNPANTGKNARTQNKYMAIRPSDGTKFDAGGAYNIDGNTLTEVVSRINEGQITQYPFTIVTGTGANKSTQFKIGKTHGQWWQLNMEDEDLTVWYTLDDPYVCNVSDVNANDYKSRNSRSQENCLMYSAVPYDAANNFYIFSKGNIFYSGVGHSNVGSEEEKKLFVNTLVAAYRPKFGLPFVQVTSSEASLTKTSPRTYSVTLPVDYVYTDTGAIDWSRSEIITSGASTDFIEGNYIYVKFKAMDNNGCSTIYTTAHYAKANGKSSATEVAIYSSLANAKNGNAMTPTKTRVENIDGTNITKRFYDLTVGDEYYVRFLKSDLGNANRYRILFESYNNRVTTGEMDKTYLEFRAQPLFNLD